ncbi:MS4A8 isoform 6, partial [Pan troglodytes]
MNSMTSAVPVANSVLVVAPHNGYPVTPGIMSQVPLYPNSQPQVHLVPGNPPSLVSNVNGQPVQKALKEGKTLGAIQIIIGLAHIGLGSIMATVLVGEYLSISFYGGFPFWGGLWFIISGSLSVAAENQPYSYCLLSGSLGLNIVSAICSAVGVILFITDLKPWNGDFWCAAGLLPPGVWHCMRIFPLWLPVGLLSIKQCECHLSKHLCSKPSDHPRTGDLTTKL